MLDAGNVSGSSVTPATVVMSRTVEIDGFLPHGCNAGVIAAGGTAKSAVGDELERIPLARSRERWRRGRCGLVRGGLGQFLGIDAVEIVAVAHNRRKRLITVNGRKDVNLRINGAGPLTEIGDSMLGVCDALGRDLLDGGTRQGR